MMHDLKPYPAYKDSGVSWLGNIPEQWELRRTKSLLRERSEKGHPDEPLLAATQTKGVVLKEQYENRTVLAVKDLHMLKFVHAGDFVISLRSFQGGIEYARDQGIISPAYTVLYTADSTVHGYLSLLFKSRSYIENLRLHVTGIRQGQNLDYEKLGRSGLPVPSADERFAIVHFLDQADRQIRRYIRAKQKLVDLLEEQKQAVIHRAVTCGINSNARLKQSGLEWQGDVPEHWEVAPLKRAFKSMDYGISERSQDDGKVPVLGMGNIRDGNVKIPTSGGVNRVASELLLKPGDLLFNRTNSAELVGKVGLFRDESIVTFASYLVRMRPARDNDPRYLNYILNDYQMLQAVRREAIPSLHQSNLNPTRYGRLAIALPPAAEQILIVSYLDKNTAELERAIANAKREISLLREYRTRLIADVVTGKLDVRQAAERLPDETEDLTLVDEALEDGEEAELTSDELAEEEVIA